MLIQVVEQLPGRFAASPLGVVSRPSKQITVGSKFDARRQPFFQFLMSGTADLPPRFAVVFRGRGKCPVDEHDLFSLRIFIDFHLGFHESTSMRQVTSCRKTDDRLLGRRAINCYVYQNAQIESNAIR